MGGVAVSIKIDDREVRKMLGGILRRISNPAPVMKIIGAIARTSIVRNFEKGGRPTKWKALSPETLKRKKGTAILREQGMAGGLMGAVNYKPFPRKVILSANKIYAAIHHFGGKAGRGRKVTIPARPYMMVQDEDWVEMKAALNDFIIQGRTA
jgi:phage virion morphogenesis protein